MIVNIDKQFKVKTLTDAIPYIKKFFGKVKAIKKEEKSLFMQLQGWFLLHF